MTLLSGRPTALPPPPESTRAAVRSDKSVCAKRDENGSTVRQITKIKAYEFRYCSLSNAIYLKFSPKWLARVLWVNMSSCSPTWLALLVRQKSVIHCNPKVAVFFFFFFIAAPNTNLGKATPRCFCSHGQLDYVSIRGLCVLVGLSAELQKNYPMDIHDTWMEDGSLFNWVSDCRQNLAHVFCPNQYVTVAASHFEI